MTTTGDDTAAVLSDETIIDALTIAEEEGTLSDEVLAAWNEYKQTDEFDEIIYASTGNHSESYERRQAEAAEAAKKSSSQSSSSSSSGSSVIEYGDFRSSEYFYNVCEEIARDDSRYSVGVDEDGKAYLIFDPLGIGNSGD